MIVVNPGSTLLPGFLRQGRSFCHKECPHWHRDELAQRIRTGKAQNAGGKLSQNRESLFVKLFLFEIKNVSAKFDKRLG